jgi:hypothetical protein
MGHGPQQNQMATCSAFYRQCIARVENFAYYDEESMDPLASGGKLSNITKRTLGVPALEAHARFTELGMNKGARYTPAELKLFRTFAWALPLPLRNESVDWHQVSFTAHLGSRKALENHDAGADSEAADNIPETTTSTALVPVKLSALVMNSKGGGASSSSSGAPKGKEQAVDVRIFKKAKRWTFRNNSREPSAVIIA